MSKAVVKEKQTRQRYPLKSEHVHRYPHSKKAEERPRSHGNERKRKSGPDRW